MLGYNVETMRYKKVSTCTYWCWMRNLMCYKKMVAPVLGAKETVN